jgi:hypothetical protein
MISNNYDDCYVWRKIVLRSELWSKLPLSVIELICDECVKEFFYKMSSGITTNGYCSRLDGVTFEILVKTPKNKTPRYGPYRKT